MLVYLHKRKTGFTKKEKRKRTNIQVHRRSRRRYSRTHNHLPRRHTNQLAVSPTSIPLPPHSPTPPTQERSTHLPKKKRWKHHPHQSNRNRIVPLISQRKTRSTLRIALKCRPPPPLSLEKEEGNTQSSQRPSHRNSTYPRSLPEEEKWAEYPAFLMPIAGACAPGPHGRYSVQHPL